MDILTKENYKKYSYTLSEIFKNEHPDLWGRAEKCIRDLGNWQKMTVELFPVYHQQVLEASKNRTSKMAQLVLMNYIKLRTIYAFAYEIWNKVNSECHNVAYAINENDHDGEEKAKSALVKSLEGFERISIIDIVKDEVSGFFRLYRQVKDYNSIYDIFQVLCRISEDGLHIQSSFLDIVGNIQSEGLLSEYIWDRATKSPYPTEPNISGLMESEEDNEMVRVY